SVGEQYEKIKKATEACLVHELDRLSVPSVLQTSIDQKEVLVTENIESNAPLSVDPLSVRQLKTFISHTYLAPKDLQLDENRYIVLFPLESVDDPEQALKDIISQAQPGFALLHEIELLG